MTHPMRVFTQHETSCLLDFQPGTLGISLLGSNPMTKRLLILNAGIIDYNLLYGSRGGACPTVFLILRTNSILQKARPSIPSPEAVFA